MKRFLLVTFLWILAHGVFAQNEFTEKYPYLKQNSPVFGKDIIINDQPSQNQRVVEVCSAFNGWLFSAYTYINAQNFPYITIFKSVDDGMTWSHFANVYSANPGLHFSNISITTTGNSVPDLKVFLSGVITNDDPSGLGNGAVFRFDGESGVYEERILLEEGTYFMTLASDFLYPATNSTSGTLGVLFSKRTNLKDSIIFRSSSNNGISLDGRQCVATSGTHFHRVSLCYGRCPAYPEGRYFASWEEKDDWGDIPGRIYTAHSEPNFNSPFTTPVRLDNLDPADANQCKNPVIACQYNDVDNDSSNMTQIIMFEKYDEVNHKCNIVGYYNLQAVNSTYFKKFSFINPEHNTIQPDLTFNPYTSSFIATYFDSTDKKLPFLDKNFNLVNPNSWIVINPGYNDSPDITSPHPQVSINFDEQEGMNVWSADLSNGNGIAMFDAEYSTYTGISKNPGEECLSLLNVFPNPCSSIVTIQFEQKLTENVSITLSDMYGQILELLTDKEYSKGDHKLQCSVGRLNPGTYILSYISESVRLTRKLTVIK